MNLKAKRYLVAMAALMGPVETPDQVEVVEELRLALA